MLLRLLAEVANAKGPGPLAYAGGLAVAGIVAAWVTAELLGVVD